MKRRFSLFVVFFAACALLAVPAQAQRVSPESSVSSFLNAGKPKKAHKAAPTPTPDTTSAAGAAPSQYVPPQNGNSRIVAVVNDNVITTADLEARLGMAFLTSGLPNTPEVRARLLGQLLRIMIDEQLQLQEAKKLDISVSSAEVDRALERIGKENNIPGGDVQALLSSHGVSPQTLVNQIRAGISWNKVIQRELRPRVDVGDDEVEAVLDRTRANAGKQEYLVSEIFLSVDNPKDEEQVKQLAKNIVQRLRAGGNFGGAARQFSQNPSGATGGDIGWIQDGQLAPELNRALSAMTASEISDPIRSSSGYHILGLREKRTIAMPSAAGKGYAIELQQVFRPFGNDRNKPGVKLEAEKIRSTLEGCENLQDRVTKQFPTWRWQSLGVVKLADAPAWITEKTRNLPVGKPSDAMEVNKGAMILFVCDRKESEASAEREAILDQIGTEKLELQARGLLRDLRRNAYLDVRLGKPQP